MYAYTPTQIHIHKTFFYVVRKFYFDKRKAKNYHNSERESSIMRRSRIVIVACNKQLSARLATTGQPYLARLH